MRQVRIRTLFSARFVYYARGRAREFRSRTALLRGREFGESERTRRLREILRFAYDHSLFYRTECDRAGFRPSEVTTLQDLQKLPVIDKQTLKREVRQIITSSPDRMERTTTSGSTGIPLELLRSARDCWYGISWERAYRLHGFNPHSGRHHRLLRLAHPHDFYGYHHKNLAQLSVNDPPSEIARRFLEFRPTIVEGYPTDLGILARELAGRDGVPTPAKIFTHSELLDASTRARIESVLGAKVTDLYGAKEFGCIAWQCEEGHYHVNDDFYVLEVLRPDGTIGFTGRGEVIVTGLGTYGMPLLRYRLGDVLEIETSPLPCRFRTTQINVLEGKVYDFLRRENGDLVSPHTVRQLVGGSPGVGAFQITQFRDGTVELTLVLEPTAGANLVEDLRSGLQKIFGPGLGIRIRTVERIDRPSDVKFKTVRKVDRDYGG